MVDLSDDFSTYAVIKTTPDTTQAFNFTEDWVGQNTDEIKVDLENQRISYACNRNQNDNLIIDLGSPVSDTAWVLRYRHTITKIVNNNTNSTGIFIGLYDEDGTNASETPQDSIAGAWIVTNTTDFFIDKSFVDDANMLAGLTGEFTREASTGVLYVELKRNSSTQMEMSLFSDDTYTTLLEGGTVAIPSTLVGLQYLGLKNLFASSPTTTNEIEGTIDNIQLWDGVSEAPTTDNFDLVENFKEDFTSYLTQPEADASWFSNDTVNAFQIANIRKDRLDFQWTRDGTNDSISHALGFTASDTEWTLRFKFSVTALGTQNNIVYAGLSDSDSLTASSDNQDFLGIILRNTGTDEGFSGGEANGAGITQEATFGLFTWAVQDYYIEVRRTSATTYTCSAFSDVEFQTVIATANFTTVAGIVGLNHIVFRNDDINTATGGWIGSIDDIQFWNDTPAVDGWLKQDTDFYTVDRNGKTIDFIAERNALNTNMSLDLGFTLSDTAWVMRLHNVSITSLVPTPGGAGGVVADIGMGDSDSTSSDADAIDFIGFTMFSRSSIGNQHWFTDFLDNQASNAVSGVTRFDKVPLLDAGERYWLEVARTSATTARYRIYGDAGFTSLMEEITETIPATITGLRHIWFSNTSGPVVVADIIGTIDKIEVLDGATEMISKDFEDDFSRGTDDWSDIGTGVGVDTANQVLKADGSDSGTSVNNQTSFDLGVGGVSNDEWTLRFKYTPTSTIQGGNADQCRIQIGLFDLDENTDMDTAQDGIFFSHRISSVVPGIFAITDVDGASPFFGAVNDFSLTVVQGDSYFVELKRTSLTTFSCSIYTDSTYTDIVETVTGTGLVSGTQNLRFIKVGNIPNDPNNDSTVQAEIDDIQFFNTPSVPFEDDFSRVPIFSDNFNNLTFFDDFATATNWVQTGTGVSITGGALAGWGADGTDRRVTHTLAEPLSDTDWVLDFEYRFTASNNPLHRPMDITDRDVDLNTTTNDAGFTMNHNMNTFTDGIRIQWVNNDGAFNQSGDIELSASTTYFIRIERIGGTEIVLNVYSDAERTTHITGSPVSRTDVPRSLGGLKYLVSGTNTNGSPTRTLTGTIDNLSISDASWAEASTREYVVNGTNNNIDFSAMNATDDNIVHDLGAGVVDSAKWRLRFKVNFSTLTAGVATNCFFGLSDSDEIGYSDVAQDHIMARLTHTTDGGGTFGYGCIDADNLAPAGIGFEDFKSFTFLTGVDYFVEVKRLSLTAYTVDVFSDSSFTTSVGGVSTGVTTAGVTGLRFIKFQGITTAGTGDMIGTIDDVSFVNGEVWSQTGDDILVNNSTEVIDFTYDGDGLDDAVSFDLGVAQSQDQWTLRTKVDLTTLTNGADGSRSIIWYGLSDSNDTVAGDASQDSIGLLFGINNGDARWFTTHSDAGSLIQNITLKTTLIVTQAYFLEITRTSPTTARYRLYSDADYSDLIEEGTETVASTTAGLRFIKVSNSVVDGTEDSTITGTTDDIEFYSETVAPKAIDRNTTSQDFDFSDATGWVQTNTGTAVNTTTQQIEGWGADGTDRRVTFDMGTDSLLSEEDWTVEFEFEFSASNLPAHDIFILSDTDTNSGVAQDHIGIRFGVSDANVFFLLHGDNTTIGGGGGTPSTIALTVNTRYFVRLERFRNTNARLSVFSDPDFTQQITSSPSISTAIPAGITGLQYIHSQCSILGSGTRTLSGIIDNLKVYKGTRAKEHEDVWKEVDE